MRDLIMRIHQGDVVKCKFDDIDENGRVAFPTDGRIGKTRLAIVLSNDEELNKSRNILVVPLSTTLSKFKEEYSLGLVLFNNSQTSYPCFNSCQMLRRSRIVQIMGSIPNEKFIPINEYFTKMHLCENIERINTLVQTIKDARNSYDILLDKYKKLKFVYNQQSSNSTENNVNDNKSVDTKPLLVETTNTSAIKKKEKNIITNTPLSISKLPECELKEMKHYLETHTPKEFKEKYLISSYSSFYRIKTFLKNK